MVEIYFIVDGKDYAFRVWPAVPRVGERVLMHPKEGPKPFVVDQVTWGVREEEARDRVTCNVALSAS